MSTSLPKIVDGLKLASTNAVLEGEMSLKGMARLQEATSNAEGVVKVDLQFGMDEQRRRTIIGSAAAQVDVVCQRCLNDMTINLEATVSLGLVSSEAQAEALPGEYEPLFIDVDEGQGSSRNRRAGEVVLESLLEDELLLVLPLAPMHPDDEYCAARDQGKSVDAQQEVENGLGSDPVSGQSRQEQDMSGGAGDDKKPNPFAVLKNLKTRSTDD